VRRGAAQLRSDRHTLLLRLDDAARPAFAAARAELQAEAAAWFAREGVAESARQLAWSAELRYRGQNYELSVPVPDRAVDADTCGRLLVDFHPAHEQAYGFASPHEPVELVNLKVKARGMLDKPALARLPDRPPGTPSGRRDTIFDKGAAHPTPVYRRAALARGQVIAGPAIVEQLDATVVVFPGDRCRVDDWGNLLIELS